MKAILGLLLGLICLSRADVPSVTPAIPSTEIVPKTPAPPWRDEEAIKAWIVLTVQYAPPVGGKITVLRHWKPKYANNDKVGEMWIIPALVNVEMSSDNKDNEMNFCVYHVDTGVSEVMVSFGVPDEQLEKYLRDDASDSRGI